MVIEILPQDFDAFARLKDWHHRQNPQGGICHFLGTMRETDAQARPLQAMNLEHYPGMCEKTLTQIAGLAKAQFQLNDILIVHRSGRIEPAQIIVLAAVSAAHRAEAFSGCAFIADSLKTRAPFWKEEIQKTGESSWVAACDADDHRQKNWRLG